MKKPGSFFPGPCGCRDQRAGGYRQNQKRVLLVWAVFYCFSFLFPCFHTSLCHISLFPRIVRLRFCIFMNRLVTFLYFHYCFVHFPAFREKIPDSRCAALHPARQVRRLLPQNEYYGFQNADSAGNKRRQDAVYSPYGGR